MRQTYVVGITGGSGSGKTSFVRALKERLGEGATLISQDDYYKPIAEVPVDDSGVHNFDLPESIDSAAMARDIERVLAGETVTRAEYGFETAYRDDTDEQSQNQRPSKTLKFSPAPILLIEGLFAFHEPALSAFMDLRVFIDVSDVAKLSRRIRRDRVERGLPLEDVLFRYEAHVLPAYEAYIAPYKSTADIVVNNRESFTGGLKVLGAFLDGLVRKPSTTLA